MPEYKLDAEGNLKTNALTQWHLTHLAGSALLLTLDYAESEEQLHTGERHQITLALTPQGALDFADGLKRYTEGFLQGTLPAGTLVH